MKLWHTAVTYRYTLKHTISINTLKVNCKYTNNTIQFAFSLISWNFYTRRRQKWDKPDNLRQNTACFEHKFSPVLKILHHSWRWWRWHLEGLPSTDNHISWIWNLEYIWYNLFSKCVSHVKIKKGILFCRS